VRRILSGKELLGMVRYPNYGRQEFFEALPSVADTSTVAECYRAIALIRELGEWSISVYRPWFRCGRVRGGGAERRISNASVSSRSTSS